MEDIFCRIIKGEIPSAKIYEDDDVLAILDISQVTKGHSLVMPKAHYNDLLECPKDVLAKVFEVAKAIGNAQKALLGAKGVNILSNAGETAGQSVLHFHVHVIPRYSSKEENFEIRMNEGNKEIINLNELANQLRKTLN